MSPQTHRIVVVGTGTGIGKTHAAVALVAAVARRGLAVVGLKPVETGVDEGDTDSAQLARVSSSPVHDPPPYTFPDPISPHIAARRAGVVIDLDRIRTWVMSHTAAVVIIETAGGLLSPLGDGHTNLDLARSLDPTTLLLVAQDRLGVLHDVTACTEIVRMRAPELPAPGIILQPPSSPDTSTGINAAEIEHLQLGQVLATFPRDAATSPAAIEAAGPVLRAVLRLPDP